MIDSDFLKKFAVLSSLSNKDIEILFKKSRLIDFEKGDTIIHEGDQADCMYLLIKGEIQIIKRLVLKLPNQESKESDKVLIRLKDEQHVIFGEVGILKNDKRTATIRAITNCTLLELTKDQFNFFAKAYPEQALKIVYYIASNLSNYLQKANEDVTKLTTALSLALSI